MGAALDEVPGAAERPSGCRVTIRAEGERVEIALPPRGLSPVVFGFAAILLGNLLLALYTGLMLLLANKSVLGMAQIAPGGLPVSLRHEVGVLLAGLGLAEALGFWTLSVILRPLFFHETLTFAPGCVEVCRSDFGRIQRRTLARADVRGFVLRRVPPGLDAGRLLLLGRGEEVEIGEGLRECDREWLASAGNALLRRHS